MNKHLLFFNLKTNLVMFISFLSITLMYGIIATTMFDPESAEAMQQLLELMPEAMVNMMGFNNLGTELTSYLGRYLYGFIMFIFPMIFIVMLGNRLMAKQVDNSSMAYLLTTPNSRVKIATTQALTLFLNVFMLILLNVTIVIITAEIAFKGHLMIGRYIGLNFVLLGVLTVVSSLVFLISTIFSDASKAVGYGSGFVGFFFIMNMIKKLNSDLEPLKFTTILSLIDIDRILDSTTYIFIAGFSSLIAGILIFIVSVIYFNKKSLTI
jgi:ABC-2 type transport system permease protein